MEARLVWADYLIVAAFLVISLAIGLYHSLTGGKQKTTTEFIMANRQLKVIPTAISLLVSFQSAIMVLGFSAEVYVYGIQLIFLNFFVIVASVLFVERLIVPWIYPLKLVSVYEYLELRFSSKAVRVFGASMGILSAIIYMGVAMYAPSAALEAVTGLPLVVSIPVMAAVSVAYTSLGGMRAVIWTDVFQFLIMMGGMLAIFIKGLMIVGGPTNVIRIASDEGRLNFANFNPDPRERHTVWNVCIGLTIGWLSMYGLSQASVQRYSAIEDITKARITILLNIPPVIIMYLLVGSLGLIVLAYFASIGCDPFANNDIQNPNQLLPYFVMTIFAEWPGFAGLFLATLYGGSLSSVSSSLSGSAANCWEDILKWKLSHLTESRKALLNRMLVVIFGTLATAVAFLSASVPGTITQISMTLSTSVGGPLFGMYVLGSISKHANWKGTLIGGLTGLACSMWLGLGSLGISSKHFALPPVSTDHCDANYTDSAVPLRNYTSVEDLYGIDTTSWLSSNERPPARLSEASSQIKPNYHGIQNVYAISYLWFMLIGVLVTTVVGLLFSLIFRDKELERKVESRLLLRIRNCGCGQKGNVSKEEDEECEKLAYITENNNTVTNASGKVLESKEKQSVRLL